MSVPKPDDFEPEPTFPSDYKTKNKRGEPRCQAWSRTAGRQCAKRPRKGQIVCRNHGADAPSGRASGTYVDGRRSKYLPEDLRAELLELEEQEGLLSSRPELANLDKLASDAMIQYAQGDALDLFKRLRSAYQLVREGRAEGDASKMAEGLNQMGPLLDEGESLAEAADNVVKISVQRSKMAEREHRRRHREEHALPKDKLFMILDRFAQTIARIHEKHDVPNEATRDIFQWLDEDVKGPPKPEA
jgi:hypothetical protein